MLKPDGANALVAAINQSFAEIGRGASTKMPRSRRNTEPAVWEFFVAKHLRRLADAREHAAHKAAVKLGLIFDHARDPKPPGTQALVYAGDVIEIGVSVTTPGTRLDATKLGVELVKAGVKLELVERLFRECTCHTAAPHTFTPTLITQ